MTAMEPKLEDAEQALTAAIVASLAEPRRHQLTEVMFGQYTDPGAGWWFLLQFLSEAGNASRPREEDDTLRIGKVVRAWSARAARDRDEENESTQRAPKAPRTGGSPS